MAAVENGPTLGDRLRSARRRRFVGRAGEIELFRAALDADTAAFSVLFLYGPGGVGKSALLGELSEVARRRGVMPVVVDARMVAPEPSAFLTAWKTVAVQAPESAETVARPGRRVVMIDTYEALAPLDDWVRERFLPELPGDMLVVIAGREAPSPRWAADPGWRELLRVVSLRNLRPEETRAYLGVEGVPEELHEQVADMTHGHPLTLSLTVDMIGKRRRAGLPVPEALTAAPNVVRALLGRVIDEVPSPRHGEALQLSAGARFTTEDLLRALLGGEDVPRLFAWLRALSFVDEGPYGLYPHDVARDILDADLRWRDSARHAALQRRLRAHFIERVRQAQANESDRHQHIADILFLIRSHPIVSSYWRLTGLGEIHIAEMRPADTTAVLDMTRRLQSEEEAMLAAHWMERQHEGFAVFRDSAGTAFGYAARLALHEADGQDLAADPGTRAMWEYALRNGPPRPGESVTAWRFFVDTEPETHPSRAETLIRLWMGQVIITRGGRAWDLIAVPADRDYWDPLLDYIDFHRAAEARYQIGGRTYDVYAHDWRRLGVDDWLELIADREPGVAVTPPSGPAPELVLSQPDFADAVRAALRDLHRPDRLADNPLLRSRLVSHRPGAAGHEPGGRPQGVAELRRLIREAAETVRADPRDDSLYRVLDRTFLRPAPTQERAAELLGLPFSTYRRHRNRGVERVVTWLWQRELYGPDARRGPGEMGRQMDSG